MKDETKDNEERELQEIDTIESQISAFAAKIGEETENKYHVYVYRMVKNEGTGRIDRPFIAKFNGIEPDPQQIAEKYRGGKYLITFSWRKGSQQKTRSYTLDIDSEAFPPLPKNGGSLVPAVPVNGPVSEGLQVQLVMMQTIGEIMKEAYRSGNNGGGQVMQQNPAESLNGIIEAVENTYTKAMAIQSKIMERIFTRGMEQRFGLTGEGEAAAAAPEEQSGLISQYAPVVKEIVDGLKTVFSFFGDKVPKDVVKRVQNNDRFRALIKDPKALVVVGQALRREFGDDKAKDIMKSFGVNMVIKPTAPAREIAQTPDIPGITDEGTAKSRGNGGKVVQTGPARTVANKGKGERKRGELVKA